MKSGLHWVKGGARTASDDGTLSADRQVLRTAGQRCSRPRCAVCGFVDLHGPPIQVMTESLGGRRGPAHSEST